MTQFAHLIVIPYNNTVADPGFPVGGGGGGVYPLGRTWTPDVYCLLCNSGLHNILSM